MWKKLFPIIAGHILEHYNITLYGFFTVILAPLFTSNNNRGETLMLAFGTIAASSLIKPFGGIFFGHLGDRLGRKKALLSSIMFISFPTLIIGLLPPYAQIGIAAPFILLFCLMLQSFCFSGELCGSCIFLVEHAQGEKTGLGGGVLLAIGFSGALLATLIGMVCTLPQMPHWGWRIPFIVGGGLGIIIYMLRKKIEETPAFELIKNENELLKYPLLEVFKYHKKSMLCTFLIGGCLPVSLFIATIYMNVPLIDNFGFSSFQIMCVNTLNMLLWILFFPVMGIIADRIGKHILMIASSFFVILCVYPFFWLISNSVTPVPIFIFQFFIAITGTAFAAPAISFMPELFPIQERYSGVSFSFNLGQAILGGTAPLIAVSSVSLSGSSIAPAFYLMFTSLLCLIAVYTTRWQEKKGAKLIIGEHPKSRGIETNQEIFKQLKSRL